MQQRRRINAVRSKPTLAILLAVALVASGFAAANTDYIRTQGTAMDPVPVMNETTSFDSGANVLVDDPAITAQGEETGPRTVKEFQREEPFSMFALTWTGQRDVTAFVRAQKDDGSWTEWFDMEPLSVDNNDPNATHGTELIFHGTTNRIQVSTLNVDLFGADAGAVANDDDGNVIPAAEYAAEPVPAEEPAESPAPEAPAEAPAEVPTVQDGLAPLPSNYGDIQPVAEVASDLEAVFIDGNAEAGVGGMELVADSDGMPRVISRAGWGASSNQCNTTIDSGVSAITIHHTAGSNDYTPAESAARMRGYHNYHANTLGWCDIGYHALVDKYGTIYEGRAGGMNRAVRGAHAGGFNENTWAISMMGNYENVTPPAATVQAVGELAGWRAKVAGFEPKGYDTHYSEGSSYTFYPYGAAVSLPNIFAHRDVGTTSCPGNSGYAQMGAIRDIAQAKYTSILSGSGDQSGTTAATTTTTTTTTPTTPATTTQAPVDGEVTVTVTPEPAAGEDPAMGSSDLAIGSSDLLNGADSEQVLVGLGSILAVILGLTTAGGDLGALLGNTGNINGVPVLEDVSLADVVPVGNTVANLTGDNEFSRTWNALNNTLGPVLGAATGGATAVQYASGANSEVSYMAFENGIMVSSPEAGTHGLWGVIGDTWAKQGADLGPLGLPINHEYRDGNVLRVDFQGGFITYDPYTGEVDLQLT
ncbi:N-acetylmuramoyl-L-alanine amidase [Corynebacterium efficiens YS-314]|uniref:N-acetylmuramoyl-L-alanine amidase n=1 Tax=Corynebacterium efficiens TaxID=152794 RepID=UPI0001B86D0F|nr:N-acetylmuramoyl-L-alanine amidase [Corynebacterium efficiens]EEW51250.1 N-acetylmuramoyl-L-alanine amidase [Corynebacterium efficiens YS-314]